MRSKPDAEFRATIAQSPNDEDARSVYADWLEERGDNAYAESLRLDSALQEGPPSSEIKKLAKRLEQLRSKTAKEWRAAIMRWSSPKDFEALPLEAARERMKASSHANAPRIEESVTEFVESLGADANNPYGVVRVYDKSVAFASDLEVSASSVAVLGDLAIGKQYTDLIEADQSLLAVAGTMRCGAVWQLGDLFVAGDLVCDGAIYGASYSSHRSEILGSVRTRVIIENGHHFVIHGTLDAVAAVGDRISVSRKYLKRGRDIKKLDRAVLDDDDEIDEAALYKLICDERDVLAIAAEPSSADRRPRRRKA